jgi:hypothetical protein
MDWETELLNSFEAIVHRDFPNPHRIGCPGRDSLAGLGRMPWGCCNHPGPSSYPMSLILYSAIMGPLLGCEADKHATRAFVGQASFIGLLVALNSQPGKSADHSHLRGKPTHGVGKAPS